MGKALCLQARKTLGISANAISLDRLLKKSMDMDLYT